jgi:hypothetical protein
MDTFIGRGKLLDIENGNRSTKKMLVRRSMRIDIGTTGSYAIFVASGQYYNVDFGYKYSMSIDSDYFIIKDDTSRWIFETEDIHICNGIIQFIGSGTIIPSTQYTGYTLPPNKTFDQFAEKAMAINITENEQYAEYRDMDDVTKMNFEDYKGISVYNNRLCIDASDNNFRRAFNISSISICM